MAHKQTKPGRPPKYPWRKWLSGKKVTLTKGVDFQCETYIFILQARRTAKPMGMRVRALVNGDTVLLTAVRAA